jgi:hypothetical protein
MQGFTASTYKETPSLTVAGPSAIPPLAHKHLTYMNVSQCSDSAKRLVVRVNIVLFLGCRLIFARNYRWAAEIAG